MLAPSRLFLLPPFPLSLQLVRNCTTWPLALTNVLVRQANQFTEIVISLPSKPYRLPYPLSNFSSRHLPLKKREMGATSKRTRMRGVYVLIPNRCPNDFGHHRYYPGDVLDKDTRLAMAKMVEKES